MTVFLGLLACAVSAFCFSSMYVLLRKFEISDGKINFKILAGNFFDHKTKNFCYFEKCYYAKKSFYNFF